MSKRTAIVGFISTAFTVLTFIQINCTSGQDEKSPDLQQMIGRGKYLVELAGCHDCHSPKIITAEGTTLDEALLLSGHTEGAEPPEIDLGQISSGKWFLSNDQFTAYVGGWGVSFAKNLTPDRETGVGSWTEDDFIKAMSSRIHLLPMPSFGMASLSMEDLRAIFAYLKTVKPIRNPVPDPISLEELKKMQ